MGICKFINSRDIVEYLSSINYQFSTIEAAYLVYQSKRATLEEKINLEFLVNTYRAIWLEEDNKEYQKWYNVVYRRDCYQLGGMKEEEIV